MQVVINVCYGGFSYSVDALVKILDRKGLAYSITTDGYGDVTVETNDAIAYGDSFDRNDPDVIAVVTEMGEAASGNLARLVVVEVEPNRLWRIAEYDGYEHIEYFDPADWCKS